MQSKKQIITVKTAKINDSVPIQPQNSSLTTWKTGRLGNEAEKRLEKRIS
jgi:hypothetical protein